MKRNSIQKPNKSPAKILKAPSHDSNQSKTSHPNSEERLRAVDRRITRRRSIYMAVIVLFIMILTVALILNVMRRNAPKPQFLFIQEGDIEHRISSDALLVRQDQLINATSTGVVKPLIQEGSKVSYGQTVALIIDQVSEPSINELKNCEQQIAALQIELMNQGKGLGARGIYDESDRDLSEIVDLIRRESMRNVLHNTESFKSSIKVMIERRNNRLQSVDFQDARLNELKTQKQIIESRIGLAAGTLTAKLAGIISYHLDGYEDELTPQALDSLTWDQYDRYTTSSVMQLIAGRVVSTNEPVARITDGVYQYLVLSIPSGFLLNFEEKSVHTIRVPLLGMDIKHCVVVKVHLFQDQSLVVFRTDMQLSKLLNKRTFEAGIAVKNSHGLRIPVSAIMDFDKETNSGSIFIVQGGYVRKAGIDIVDYDREYAIIKPDGNSEYQPKVNGYLVKNPSSVREGESIGGTR
jgi:hypothetical protein